MPSSALFIAAHPDDEILAMAVPVAEHVAAGQDVHVLLLSRGTGSGVRAVLNGTAASSWWGVSHSPDAEGYSPLTAAAFGAARIAETAVALRCLSAGLPGTLTLHEAELLDGSISQAAAVEAIRAVCDDIAPGGAPVRLKTHSHLVDNHPDHLAAGRAARALKAEDPDRWGDLRHYILPPYWSDGRLSQVAESWDQPGSPDIAGRVRNGIRAFGAWAPPHSYAIGWHSVPDMLAALDANPRALVHS